MVISPIGGVCGAEGDQRFRWRAGRPVGIIDAMPPARGAHVLPHQLVGGRIEEADIEWQKSEAL